MSRGNNSLQALLNHSRLHHRHSIHMLLFSGKLPGLMIFYSLSVISGRNKPYGGGTERGGVSYDICLKFAGKE